MSTRLTHILQVSECSPRCVAWLLLLGYPCLTLGSSFTGMRCESLACSAGLTRFPYASFPLLLALMYMCILCSTKYTYTCMCSSFMGALSSRARSYQLVPQASIRVKTARESPCKLVGGQSLLLHIRRCGSRTLLAYAFTFGWRVLRIRIRPGSCSWSPRCLCNVCSLSQPISYYAVLEI